RSDQRLGLQSQGKPDARAAQRVLQLGHRPLRRARHDRGRARGVRAGRARAPRRRGFPRFHVHQRGPLLGRGEPGLLQGHRGQEAGGGGAHPEDMTAAGQAFTDEMVRAAGGGVELRRGGRGAPLLILHGELRVPGWLPAYARLGERFAVPVRALAGFGGSARREWIAGVGDVAAWTTWLVRDLNLPQPLPVIGFSLGGWIAAEIATVNAALFTKMVLVGAAGLQPESGPVWDYFVPSSREAFARSFYDGA